MEGETRASGAVAFYSERVPNISRTLRAADRLAHARRSVVANSSFFIH